MLEIATLLYGVLASFIIASMSRNKREQRANSPTLALASWSLFSLSGTMAVLLIAYAGWTELTRFAV